tara:strand:- start:20 stop:307 length:288 start_codon:yes stop_codon:yes gene_type:complete
MTTQLDYKVAIEIDIDCEELVDAIGLGYTRSEDDDTQNVIMLTLDEDDFEEIQHDCPFNYTNETDLGGALLNPELGEYVTKVTIHKPNGDVICFY